jgi:hypothetical protein
MVSLGLLILKIQLPGCASLKEKRSRIKPLLARLHREFDISAAEIESLDVWQSAGIACALVSNDPNHTRRALQEVARWVDENWPDVILEEEQIELR